MSEDRRRIEDLLTAARRRIAASREVAARGTTVAGEREAAYRAAARLTEVAKAHALRMIDKAGLDPDDFDIPGRTQTKPTRPPAYTFRDNLFERPRSPFFGPKVQLSEADLREALLELSRQTEASIRRAAEQMNDPAYKREVEDFVRQYRDKSK